MKDNAYYFPHDYGARNDPKLQEVLVEHGAAGIGAFWCIIEQLYEQGGAMPLKSCKSIAFALHLDCTMIESIIKDYGLFENDGEKFWSNSVNARINKRTAIVEKRKAAAASRWRTTANQQVQCKDDANAMQTDAKEKKRKENKSISNDIEREKAKTVKRFCPPTLQEVQAYIQEKGYSIDAEAFIAFYESKGWMVGKNKMKDWRMAIVTWSKRDNRPATSKKSQTNKSCNDEWT